MIDVIIQFAQNEDGSWSWIWEGPDEFCRIGAAETVEEAEEQARMAVGEWYGRVH